MRNETAIRKKNRSIIERNQRILSKIEQGIAFYEIAEEFGMTFNELSDFAEASAENEKFKLNLEIKNLIIQLHKQGKNHDEIAAAKKIDISLVNKTLSDYFQNKANPKPVSLPAEKDKLAETKAIRFLELSIQERIKRNKDVISAYQEGLSCKEVAEKYGIAYFRVCNILKSNQIPLRKRKRNPKELQNRNNEIITAYQNGLTVSEIAGQYKIVPCTVYQILKSNKIQLRKIMENGRASRQDENSFQRFLKIKKLHEQGMSFREIGTLMSMNYRSIWNLLRQKGVIGLKRDRLKKIADQVEILFKEGVSRKQICERLNTTITFVNLALNRRGYDVKNYKRNKIVQA